MKFLGDVGEERVGEVGEALRRAAGRHGPLRLKTGGPGAFPSPGRARVIWAGVEGELEKLAALRDEVESELSGIGFERERKPFHPHLTLGRARRGPVRMPETEPAAGAAFVADRLTLMKSELRREGAVHTALAHAPLTGEERRRKA